MPPFLAVDGPVGYVQPARAARERMEILMRSRLARVLAPGACVAACSIVLGTTTPIAAAVAKGVPGVRPGRYNAITDVPGILVGQVQKTRPPYLTGSTVVAMPNAPVAGVSVSGGDPGTWMTDRLSPLTDNPGTNAIVLTGGSSWGMDVGVGAMHWLEDHGETTVPAVPGAVIYDVGRGGDAKARPTASWGYRAMGAATVGPVSQGTVGAGTGALAGLGVLAAPLKGGVGTASVVLPDGTIIGALVVVNPLGSPVNLKNCTLLGADLGIGGEFAGLKKPSRQECKATKPDEGAAPEENAGNTTIAVVATNASMDNAALTRMASVANDGLARAINPVHTLYDGDTIFAVATGTGPKLSNSNPGDIHSLSVIGAAAADTLSRAVVHAMLSATSARQFKSYCDTYPSACEDLRR